MADKRIVLWDNVKFFLILLVVVGHLADVNVERSQLFKGVFLMIYAFHMPLFFFISGLFHKNTKIKEKVVSYLALYLILKIVFFFVRIVNGGEPSFKVLTEDGLPWFMFTMAFFVGITYVLRDMDKRYLLVISILLGLFSGYDKEIGKYLVESRNIVFYPFYLAGTMVGKEKLEGIIKNPKWKIAGWVVMLGWCGLCLMYTDRLYILRHLFTGQNAFNSEIYSVGFIYRGITYVITAVVGFAFMLLAPTRSLGKISEFGTRTLQIYFWHHIIVLLLQGQGIYVKFFSHALYMKAAWLLLSIPITLLVAWKPFRHPVDWILLPIRKKESS